MSCCVIYGNIVACFLYSFLSFFGFSKQGVSLCNISGCHGMHFVEQAVLDLTGLPVLGVLGSKVCVTMARRISVAVSFVCFCLFFYS